MADISKLNGVPLANIEKLDAVLAANIAKVNGLVFTSAAAQFLLDQYTGAAAAYSVRRLNSAYTGACLQVSNGVTTQDIGFGSDGWVDGAAILSFCGASDGTVTIWYDQSQSGGTGVGNDLTQTTATARAKICENGALKLENGNLLLRKSGVYTGFDFSTTISNSDVDFFAVCQAFGGSASLSLASNKVLFVAYNNPDPHTANLGTPTNFVDGSSFSGTTRADLFTAMGAGQTLLTSTALDFTSASYTATGWVGANIASHEVQELILWTSNHPSRTGVEENINSNYLIYQPTDAPTSGLLATYTGAAAAYSVRQLSDKAVIALRIRRDSDDEETNIGFDSNGDLDTTAISDFCGTANGYVTRWWDQSTNGNHADQATDASQPQIYKGTAVITENGKPALQYDGTNDPLEKSSLSIRASNVMTVSFVSAATGTGTETMLNVRADATAGNQIFYQTSTNQTRINGRNSSGSFIGLNPPSTGIKNLVVGLWDWQNDNLYGDFDGDAATSASGLTEAVTTIDRIRIGQDSGINYAQYNLNECIIWPVNTITIGDLADDINTYFSIY